MDQPLHRALLAQHHRFWYEPKGAVLAERHYGIPETFVAWKELGIITCLVYEHFEANLAFDRPLRHLCTMDRHNLRSGIHAAVRKWLEERRFPAELCGSFD